MTLSTRAARIGLSCLVAGSAWALSASAIAAPVTFDRLKNAQNESHNWLLVYGSYNAHNSSSLSQINRSNVGNLQVKYTLGLPGIQDFPAQQAIPAVNDGYMYITTPWSQLMKVDIRGGSRAQTLWVNDAEVESTGAMRGSPALLGNYVFHNTRQGQDVRLLKIDADSGETVWEASLLVEEAESSEPRFTMQPMAINDKLFVGNTGNDNGGKRGWIGAYNASDGSLAWRFWVIPGPGEFGHETWADDWGAYATGGGGMWTQGSYDPETNLVLYGTGEPQPWYDPEFRPGDNLFTVAVIALDADTGELDWYFQEIPNESWDMDTVSMRMLYDVTINGEIRKVQGNFSRNGYYYTLDRVDGTFLGAEPYTEVNWTAGLDPKTGLPVEYDPNMLVQDYAPGKAMRAGNPESSQNVCPQYRGAPTHMPPTFDAKRMMAYVGANHGGNCFSQFLEEPFPHENRIELGLGSQFGGREHTNHGNLGEMYAVDVRTGKKVMGAIHPNHLYSGALGTAGDLIFYGHLDGKFAAYDKDTLSEVWAFNTGTPISASAITYSIDGTQYVAVVAGGQNRSSNIDHPEQALVQRSAMLYVFAL